ncbi:hypothetical protein H2204_010785 [Knufia peltigerae]|uniref:SWIM-type domain-containing protein n=1 Tax=Knufia peltigerae TaxID=1002370 RepID=A0AA38XWT9_9EURO|nr:hypothetical protein H2204_010785 [Knufia peltigerae]
MSKSPPLSQITLIFNSLASISRKCETETHASSLSTTATAIEGLHADDDHDHDHDGRARSLFLTLHVLFPHELLPALDLLDRGLVTRMWIGDAGPVEESSNPFGSDAVGPNARQQYRPSKQAESETESTYAGNNEVFYVQSSSSSTSNRHHHHRKQTNTTSTPFYEVRLDSWNCTCPAFSVAAFQSINTTTDNGVHHDHDEPGTEPELEPQARGRRLIDDGGSPTWRFGGVATNTKTTTNRRPPSCKHVLAAVLSKVAPRLFGHGITSKVVNRDEVAGWGAGWGEFPGG